MAVLVNGRQASLNLFGKQTSELKGAEIAQAFRVTDRVISPFLRRRVRWLTSLARSGFVRRRYAGAWLFMDRDAQANDNAEHLYRWMRKNSDKTDRMWFVLRRGSRDWRRLKRQGFKLLAYRGLRHRLAFLNADWLISSHADGFINPFGYEWLGSLPSFAFLQHGVIQNDLSAWLNVMPIDLFVTSTVAERDGILSGSYKYSARELVLTGLPRHDELLRKASSKPDLLLIIPTWRMNLVGGRNAHGEANSTSFGDSEYYRAWQAVLGDEELMQTARQNGLEVAFVPHPNMRPYLKRFRPAKGVRLVAHARGSMQDLFARCALLITDFSSVAFDVALLQRPVIYYQFDREKFYREHFGQDYFDYPRDGFGEVAESHAMLMASVKKHLAAGCRMAPKYLERADHAFCFRDGKNCQRVYEAILARDTICSGPYGA